MLLGAAGTGAAQDRFPAAYRADALPPVRGEAAGEIQLVFHRSPSSLPAGLTADLEAQVRREWPPTQVYGRVHSSLGVWLRYPLVTAQVSGRLLVPVIDRDALPLAGSLEPVRASGPRRVVVLIDASASANARMALPAGERMSVLEAEYRALEQLLAMPSPPGLEIGVIAFGERTSAVAEPGLPQAETRARLARFRRDHPRGEGRTDAVCALWTARDWLDPTPHGVEREIVVLTDGELPHSGRFAECAASRPRDPAGGAGGSAPRAAEQACEARRNRSPCPARHGLRGADGTSDLAQLALFSRRTSGMLRLTPLVFDLERGASVWDRLARRSGSRLVRVPDPQAIETVLPALVSSRISSVRAYNARTGETTPDLLEPGSLRFAGSIGLRPGANDVELRVAGDAGLAALFRFRVYSQPGYLDRQLARLRRSNDELAERTLAQTRRRGSLERNLEISAPAAPETP